MRAVPARSAAAAAFGRAVREMRDERGLSQEELGLRSGVARGFYGKLERGEASPTFDTIVRVADALEAPAADVVARAERHLRALTDQRLR